MGGLGLAVALAFGGLVLIGLAVAPPVGAQVERTITAQADFDPPVATIGDRVTLTVRVRHSESVIVTVQQPQIPGAEFLGASDPATGADAGTGQRGFFVTTTTFRYQLFTLGNVTTGNLQIDWLAGNGTTGRVAFTGETIRVVPVRQEGDTALRPLPPPLEIAGAPPAWLRPALIALAAVVGLALLGRLVAWWRRPRTVEVAAPSEAPEAEARERLEPLRGLELASPAAFESYYGTIARTVRDYLSERFGFNAFALTTPELEARMTSHGVDRWQARLVGGLLDRCDRAVYARRYPEAGSADHDLTVAYEIIELGRPSAQMPPESEAAS